MHFLGLLFLSCALGPGVARAEFYSDVDSREGDEAKALEIKAKKFWQGLMDSAQGLETTRNAELSAQVELLLKELPPTYKDYNAIVELFNEAISHLANADSMLFEEASRAKMMALQRLENGPSREALSDYVSEFQDYLYTAYTRFVGHRTYEKKLAQHILSRLTEVDPALGRAAGMAPQMYEESEQASKCARKAIRKLGHKEPAVALRSLANDIISATGKQRARFQEYLLGSLMSTAQDLAGEKEEATQTVMRESLRGIDLRSGKASTKPFVQVDAAKSEDNVPEENTAISLSPAVDVPPLMFFDGVPVDAKPITVTVF